ncbi:SusC/RagA family TonB-linked outer membrane protein [Limibacterium fermenti]|jgi:TonB-linked SusC/RagA family outer membrane protein|uniref:SusC/RagA family TonB-linked outer membrane protein n=1 Tax=Limibacterium fermenti TaxID=3229863 RepID=UPI000E9C9D30|nr:hypothetical protein [Porphyromonadaceae bacterium]HBX46064.1 hypothetical protein [Porphyromonadaceae bacterium]
MKRERLFLVVIVTLFCTVSSWAIPPDDRTVTLKLNNVSVETFLNALKAQTGVDMLYNSQIFDGISRVSVSVNNEKWETVLKNVLTSRGLKYTITNGIVVIRPQQADKQITVRIIDEEGKPLPGATILIERQGGQNQYAMANDNGLATFISTEKDKSITASFIGYEKLAMKVSPKKNDYLFRLQSDNVLKEVVVTGIFNKPKVSFTGAATIISQKELNMAGNRSLLKSLSNIDPSFDIQENNQYGSDPNKKLSIEIRGKSSLSPNVQNINNLQDDVRNEYNLPLFILDGFEVTSERVMDMNQADVESVVILKDASATAIYGSRGANGVVVITSIKPKMGKVRVSYNVGLNLEIPDLSSYNLMNSFEKLETEKAAGLYTSDNLSQQMQLDAIYNQNFKAAQEGVNTDWIRKPLRYGLGQYHRLTLGGGTSDFRYNLNFSYNQIKGAMKGSQRDNMNGGIQISYLLKKIRFTNDLTVGLNDASESMYGDFSEYIRLNPYWKPYDENGKAIYSYSFPRFNHPIYNPLYDAEQTSFTNTEYLNVRNTTNMSIDLYSGLRADVSLGLTQQRSTYNVFHSPKSYIGATLNGWYSRTNAKMNSYQLASTLSWAKVWGKHSVYAGFNWQLIETKKEDMQVHVTGFLNDYMNDISNGTSYYGEKPKSGESTIRSTGFTSTINYNYDNRYFFDTSYRLDGASSFGAQSRWAPFWSVGVGWEFAREKWLKSVFPFLSSGKFRYSYGVTSTLNFAPYEAYMTYSYYNEQYNGLIGASIIGYGNPKLGWQDTRQHNYGVDMGFFNNRITLSANYYQKITSNLLTDAYLPISHGYTSYKETLGALENTGHDITVGFNILRIPEKDITWSVRVSTYSNKNIILELSDAIKKIMSDSEKENYTNSVLYMYKEGYSLDEIYVIPSVGIDPESGNRLYLNEDGSIVTTSSYVKKIAVGNSQPKYNGRLGTNFRWKGLLIDLGFGYRLGGKKLNNTLLTKVENADIKWNQDKRVMQLRWRQPGDVAAYKNLASTEPTYPNNLFVFTENTFTFNSVNVTYDLPISWIKHFRMERLSLTASITDLFYISNIEQERGTNYPYTIKPTFSCSCTF